MKRVGIFWDIENCDPSTRVSGMTVALNIQKAANVLGDELSSFKAYADMGLSSGYKEGQQRSDLKDSGVTLVHCPHLARKEVVDKVILVDMFDFVIGCGEPSSVVLITGDRDFTYAVTILRKRGHDVYLIFPEKTTHHGLRRVATGYLEWQSVLNSDSSDLAFKKSSELVYSIPQQPITNLNKRTKSSKVRSSINSRRRKNASARRAVLADASNDGGLPFGSPNNRASGASGDRVFEGAGSSSSKDIASSSDNPYNNRMSRIISQPALVAGPSSRTSGYSGTRIHSNHGPGALSVMDVGADSGALPTSHARSEIESCRDTKPIVLSSPAVLPTPANAAIFTQLVEVLLGERASGRMSTPSDILDELLRKSNPTLYAELGVSTFRAFIDLAQNASIVFFSDIFWENHQGWVSLRNPQLYGPNPMNIPLNPRRLHKRDRPVIVDSAIDTTQNQDPGSVTSKGIIASATEGPDMSASRHNKPAHSDSKFIRLIEILRGFRNQGMKRVKGGQLRKPLQESGLGKMSKQDAKAYIELAHTNGIICGGRSADAFVELHPDFY